MGTLADLKARIADELGGRTDLDSQIAYAIDDAIKLHLQQKFWPQEAMVEFETEAGTPNYPLPTGFRGYVLITVTDDGDKVPLEYMSWQQYKDEYGDDPDETGTPYRYSMFGGQVWLADVPDAIYTITQHFYQDLTAPLSDDATNYWTAAAEPLIRNTAKKILYSEVILDFEKAAFAERNANDWLRRFQRESRDYQGGGSLRPTCW